MTFNHGVEGPSPSALTNKIRHYLYFCGGDTPKFRTRGRGGDTSIDQAIARLTTARFDREPAADAGRQD